MGGCGGDRVPLAEVEGKVLYRGKPLAFGRVLFQPASGPVAVAKIQADGTFRVATYEHGQGAIIGKNRVQIRCYQSDAPGAAEPVEGTKDKLLIPRKYTDVATSGLAVEVKEDNPPVLFELVD
jgi:hypothetical protein